KKERIGNKREKQSGIKRKQKKGHLIIVRQPLVRYSSMVFVHLFPKPELKYTPISKTPPRQPRTQASTVLNPCSQSIT
ncbi:hypothetical protein M2132_002196, partial [Dysgonomonas sp. PH5-45]|uniref:hypothetical protein n=1 Tax=unclassified Dysgonomonas TaxID=2630389 RepID=UPI0024750707